ncbi:MAG: ORF6N domain-containing protein [Bacteroidales bacterium]|nr:ORF6N domain-containing protein [Candidatus Colicola coprequi]
MAKDKDILRNEIINEQSLKDCIYTIRGQQVMLDLDLAAIYGYSTSDFNRQVKNNIEKFPEDFYFQLTEIETNTILICKNSTSSWGGIRKKLHAFTEQGIYMLMTVLRGPIATRQSIALVRLFKQMKDYIVENQGVLGQREFLQLSLQTSDNMRDIMEVKQSLAEIDNRVAQVVDTLGEVVTRSELSDIMLDFSKPLVKYGWLILNGQPVESDLAYQQIYSQAHESIIMIDDYIGLKSLSLMHYAPNDVKVVVISDNVGHYLHQFEVDDIQREYPDRSFVYKVSNGIFHDRYIVTDYNTPNEKIYHCGASSKDGGNRVTTMTLVKEASIYHSLIDQAMQNDLLILN